MSLYGNMLDGFNHPEFGEFRPSREAQFNISRLEALAKENGKKVLKASLYNGQPNKYVALVVLDGVAVAHDGYGYGSTPERASEFAMQVALRKLQAELLNYQGV